MYTTPIAGTWSCPIPFLWPYHCRIIYQGFSSFKIIQVGSKSSCVTDGRWHIEFSASLNPSRTTSLQCPEALRPSFWGQSEGYASCPFFQGDLQSLSGSFKDPQYSRDLPSSSPVRMRVKLPSTSSIQRTSKLTVLKFTLVLKKVAIASDGFEMLPF